LPPPYYPDDAAALVGGEHDHRGGEAEQTDSILDGWGHGDRRNRASRVCLRSRLDLKLLAFSRSRVNWRRSGEKLAAPFVCPARAAAQRGFFSCSSSSTTLLKTSAPVTRSVFG